MARHFRTNIAGASISFPFSVNNIIKEIQNHLISKEPLDNRKQIYQIDNISRITEKMSNVCNFLYYYLKVYLFTILCRIFFLLLKFYVLEEFLINYVKINLKV